MNKKFLVFLFLYTICISNYGQNQRPVVPYIQNNICPGEGCQFGSWIIKSSMKVYVNEDDSNSIAFIISPNEKITTIFGNIHTLKLGLVLINKLSEEFDKNDTAFILSDIGEGFYNAWYKSKIITFESGNPSFSILSEAKTEWWVYLKNNLGKFGWLRVNENDLWNIDGWNIFSN